MVSTIENLCAGIVNICSNQQANTIVLALNKLCWLELVLELEHISTGMGGEHPMCNCDGKKGGGVPTTSLMSCIMVSCWCILYLDLTCVLRWR